MNQQPSEQYFCELPADEFSRELWQRITSPGPQWTPYGQLQQMAYRKFYGALPSGWFGDTGEPSSAVLTATGPQGNQVKMRVNHARADVLAQHQLVTNPALTWVATAVSSDSSSLQAAEKGSQILEYLWRNGSFERQALSAALSAFVAGEYFLLTLWDESAGEQLEYVEGEGVRYQGDLVCVTATAPSSISAVTLSARSCALAGGL